MSRGKTRKFEIRFLTPAFLGDAFQNGRWRAPPFKALLRAWWRVAYAEAHGFEPDTEQMRRTEGVVFGNAWLKKNFCKSLVKIRLSHWHGGRLKTLPGSERKVKHPEVKNPVGSWLYLGYGPLVYDKRKTSIKGECAVDANEKAVLSITYSGEQQLLDRAIALMARFGAVGGRCRNGWGSFEMTGLDSESSEILKDSSLPLRRLQDALSLDWPHAVGKDDRGPLIWRLEKTAGWQEIMSELANIKIRLRTRFGFQGAHSPHQKPMKRHWLSYPVTRHVVQDWGKDARLPNTLMFKVVGAGNIGVSAIIFHVPHLPPKGFGAHKYLQDIQLVWRQVHQHLDENEALKRTGE